MGSSSPSDFGVVLELDPKTANHTDFREARLVKSEITGNLLIVTLMNPSSETSINAAMLQEGLARLERKKRFDTRDKKAALEKLEEFQDKARKERLNIWRYGDIQSDDEESGPPAKAGGRR